MKKIKVDIGFDKLKYIHHTSDIQIRNLRRHTEYRQVFENFYEEIKKNKDNSVIYIGGDIAHSKLDMSPELIQMLSDLFVNLADICPTILIAGNHDCNLNNMNRLDVLTPIVDNINHPNLHYFMKSGIYQVADVDFVVWDVWDKPKDYIKAKDVDGDKKVLLFHGTVDKSETDLGFRLPSKVKISQMKGYDLVLLGDIHKRQFLDKKETIAYCGSLVQQNHGEELGHGYLKWDMDTLKSEYIEIPNEYGYYTIDVDDGKMSDISDMPTKARLRLRVSNTTPVQVKKILTLLRTKHGIEEVTVTRTDRLDPTTKVRNQAINIGDVEDEDYRFSLIEEYLKNNFFTDEDDLIDVKEVNEYLQGKLIKSDVARNLLWKIKKFEFSNMFSYGENNVVDFSKLNGIVGLFALNASGKSSLLDALTYCLFDKSSRAYKGKNIMNNKKDWFECRIELDIDQKTYVIHRKGKLIPRTGHVKVDVDFYTTDDSGEKISLNDEQRRTTDANIRRYIGTYDDFVLTSLSLQNNNTVFIDKTQKERKELMAQFMGLGVFDQLYMLANENVNEINAILKNFDKSDYDIEVSDLEKKLTESEDGLKNSKENLNDKLEELQTAEAEVLSLTKQLKNVDEELDIVELDSELKLVTEEYDSINEKNQKLKSELEHIESDIEKVNSTLEEMDVEAINERFEELSNLKSNKHDIKVEIDKLKIDVQNKLDKIKKLGDLQYDPDCDYCMNNVFVKDAIKTQDELQRDKEMSDSLVSKYDNIEININDLKVFEEYKTTSDEMIIDLETKKEKVNHLVNKIKLQNEKLKTIQTNKDVINNSIEKYYKLESDILFNSQLHEKINDLDKIIKQGKSDLQRLNDDVANFTGDVKSLATKKQTILDNIKRVEKLEKRNVAYKLFLEAVQRDGVPYDLISKSLPTIEGAVNDILAQIVDFQILFEMDGKNINCNIVYDNDNVWPLELSSGMERFISSLAIRVGLINVSNLPASNFLAIDEGWGTMDSENLNSVYNLFQFLKSQFDFSLIISHIETMRDAVDTLLDVHKKNGYSSVTFD